MNGQGRKTMRQLFISLATTIVFLAILLISAGRLGYWQAWAYAALSTVMNLCTRLILRNALDVAKERASRVKALKGGTRRSWDWEFCSH